MDLVKWQPTLVLLLGKSHGQRILVGYSPQGRKESDTTWATSLHFNYLEDTVSVLQEAKHSVTAAQQFHS